MAYQFARQITIKSATLAGTQDSSNFPLLFAGTYTYLKTVGNGGNVQNASGFDIGFYADAALTQKLAWETVSWSGSTGTVEYWVLIPYMSASMNTSIYIGYGDASITADKSNRAGVWINNYAAVYHLNDNAASTAVLDSTGNAPGVCSVNTSTISVAGQIGNAFNFATNATYVALPNVPILNIYQVGVGLTMSFWYKGTEASAATFIAGYTTAGSGFGYGCGMANASSSSGQVNTWNLLGSWSTSATPPVANTGAWVYITISVPWGVGIGNIVASYYLNGSFTGTSGLTGAFESFAGTRYVGTNHALSNTIGGDMEEVRIALVPRTASWVAAEYNNQSSPSTFYSVSAPFLYGILAAQVISTNIPAATITSTTTQNPLTSGNSQPEFGQN